MAYTLIEGTRNKRKPLTLYLFEYASGAQGFYAYNDSTQPIDYQGRRYEPVPINRSSIVARQSLDRSLLSVECASNNPVAELFRVYPPSQAVVLTIRQGHREDTDADYLVCWKGRVTSAAFEDAKVTLSCEPVNTSMKRTGLRRNYQYSCPHVLYGNDCRASESAATTLAFVQVISGSTMQLAPTWSDVGIMSQYLGGMVRWTDDNNNDQIRALLRIAGERTFLLGGVAPTMRASMQVKLIKGCARNMEICRTVHNNIKNFGGQPWIPTKNPVGNLNHFY